MSDKAVPFQVEVVPVPPAPDYFLGIDPAYQNVQQGATVGFTARVTGLAGYVGPVTLVVNGLPEGMTAVFATNPLVLTGSSTPQAPEVLETALSIESGAAAVALYDLALDVA